MAQVNTPNNPNDPTNTGDEDAQQQQETDQPSTTGGAGAVSTTGAGAGPGASGSASPAQPFQNISAYLKANEPQSQKLAQDVASTVSNPINDASAGITGAADQFTKSVNAGYTPENTDLINNVANNPAAAVASDPNNVAAFQAQLNNRYAGPTDFTTAPGYGDLQTKIANATSRATATKTPEGVQTLLKDVEGPTTAGINKLDSVLLNQNPNNLKTVQDAGAGADSLLTNLNSTASAQNALAAEGSTKATSSAAAAAKALQDALATSKTNLGSEQKSIEQIVNDYNRSVGIINPVTQSIASAIQDYLRSNPNIQLGSGTDYLSPLMNLGNVDMPDVSTYASPEDYAQIAALQQLGLVDPNGLPLDPSKANLAQTFNVPTALQDAIGKAPGVQQALADQMNSLGSKIQGAYQPYQDLLDKEMKRADLRTQLDKVTNEINGMRNYAGADKEQKMAALQAKRKSITDAANAAGVGDRLYGSYWDDLGNMAQGLQWLEPASKGYNDLIQAINAQLGKLGEVGVPTLNYSNPNAASTTPGGPSTENKIQNATSDTAALGAGGAAGVASLLPSASAITAGGSVGALDTMTSLPGAIGPAAAVALGTKNIVQNSLKNPIQSGLSTLANTGLSLATLSLPPKIFDSIGSSISNVVKSVGKFFKHLF